MSHRTAPHHHPALCHGVTGLRRPVWVDRSASWDPVVDPTSNEFPNGMGCNKEYGLMGSSKIPSNCNGNAVIAPVFKATGLMTFEMKMK